MELRDPDTGVSVSLRPVAYEFDAHVAEHGNWLVIDGQASYRRGAWAFTEPCLTAGEAPELSRWLRRVAVGEEPVSEPAEDGRIWPSLMFTEPNMSYGVSSYDGDGAVLRLHFSLDSAPPWEAERATLTAQFWIELCATAEALLAAAQEWDSDIVAYPERT